MPIRSERTDPNRKAVKMNTTGYALYAFTDADLIASFNDTQVARKQYYVWFIGNDTSKHTRQSDVHMMVWADNKTEARKLAREYAVRIMNRSFDRIVIEA